MRMMTSCTLIAFSPDAHEVGQDPVSTRRKVKCQELSLTLADKYQAGGQGLAPDARLLIPYDRDYKGERDLEYKGDRWSVIRTDPYKDWNGVILDIQRQKGNTGTDNGTVPAPAETPATPETPETPQEVG